MLSHCVRVKDDVEYVVPFQQNPQVHRYLGLFGWTRRNHIALHIQKKIEYDERTAVIISFYGRMYIVLLGLGMVEIWAKRS